MHWQHSSKEKEKPPRPPLTPSDDFRSKSAQIRSYVRELLVPKKPPLLIKPVPNRLHRIDGSGRYDLHVSKLFATTDIFSKQCLLNRLAFL
ncbi:hypothetical protein QQG55_9730 [Brugia pahangi]|uniref:Uncharacterized protein n=1 Tax=Brugia pahangi TaxID=6280 RepID=A0A0N4TCL0_BRUPA|nr:unnamed protein product [Brugia pahangi]